MATSGEVARGSIASALLGDPDVSTELLTAALAAHERSGISIERILFSWGALTEDGLRAARAQAWGLPALDPASFELDAGLSSGLSGDEVLDQGWLPVAREGDHLLVATEREITDADADAIAARLGSPVRFAVATEWELRDFALRVFRTEIADDAANALYRQAPVLSARTTLSRPQQVILIVALLVFVGLLIAWPIQVAVWTIAVIGLAFLCATMFKFLIALRGARFDVVERVTAADLEALDDRSLPTYTVLVPVFREANIVAQLVENLGDIDYPAEKLEVLVLIEEEDELTRAAFDASSPPPNFRVVTIPPGQPQTKPRACNVGLAFASGDYVVIYDAEDAPDPLQLKKALVAFERGGPLVACVQASLNYFNATENVLTRMFTLEYSYWFDYMLAGLDAYDLPIPLGGTSNHFRRSALVELGGWDPYNVTEDADLGIRASALGYRVGVIDSTTMEEANTSIPNFIRQRSRWVKGYMQTSLVHARRPGRLIAQIGLRRFLAFVLLIAGTPATFLGVIPLGLIMLVTVFLPPSYLAPYFPVWLLWLTMLGFVVGNTAMVYLSMMGPYKRGAFNLILWALLNPVYWLLHSISSYKALWQLITRPHYWEKTEHGLTVQSRTDEPALVDGASA